MIMSLHTVKDNVSDKMLQDHCLHMNALSDSSVRQHGSAACGWMVVVFVSSCNVTKQ